MQTLTSSWSSTLSRYSFGETVWSVSSSVKPFGQFHPQMHQPCLPREMEGFFSTNAKIKAITWQPTAQFKI